MVLIIRLFGLSNQFQAVEVGSYHRKRRAVHVYKTSQREAQVTLPIVTEYKIVMQSPLVLYGTLFWTFRYSVAITLCLR